MQRRALALRFAFAVECAGDHGLRAVRGEGAKIKAGAVKWIEKAGRVARERPAVANHALADIGQRGVGALVASDWLSVGEEFASDGVSLKMGA